MRRRCGQFTTPVSIHGSNLFLEGKLDSGERGISAESIYIPRGILFDVSKFDRLILARYSFATRLFGCLSLIR